MIKLKLVGLALLGLATLVGCGSDSGFPKTYKVSGTVKQAGKPVDGALVTFIPADGTKSAVGSTNAQGEYKLSTFGPGDGAMPGSYKVTVTKTAAPPAAATPALAPGVIASGDISESYVPPAATEGSKGGKTTGKNELPAKYASEATSGLIATVAENDANKFDFDL